MEDIFGFLHDDEKTTAELKEYIAVEKITPKDYEEVINIVAKTFQTNDGEYKHQFYNIAEEQLKQSKADFNESIKLVDTRDNQIYGVLILSHFPIHIGSPIMAYENTRMIGEYLVNFSQINGFAFVIDKRLRGYGFDKKMIQAAMPFIEKFDFIWVATAADYKTNSYYQRLGGFEVFKNDEAIFYIKNMAKNNMNDVFILKLLADSRKNEENNNI